MFAQQQRLRTRRDFDTLWKHGRSVYGRSLGLRFAPNGTGVNRFGVIIGLKVSKRSTKRNTIRRRIREVLRRELSKTEKGYDIAVIVQPGAVGMDFAKISEDLTVLIHRMKLSVDSNKKMV